MTNKYIYHTFHRLTNMHIKLWKGALASGCERVEANPSQLLLSSLQVLPAAGAGTESLCAGSSLTFCPGLKYKRGLCSSPLHHTSVGYCGCQCFVLGCLCYRLSGATLSPNFVVNGFQFCHPVAVLVVMWGSEEIKKRTSWLLAIPASSQPQ